MTARIRTIARGGLFVGLLLALVLWLATPAYAAQDYELAYNEYTSPVTLPSSGATTPIVTAAPINVDGATPVLVNVFLPVVQGEFAGTYATLYLYDNDQPVAIVGYTATGDSGNASASFTLRRIVPAAGAHTYSVRGAASNGQVTLSAGSGASSSVYPSGFVRITRANPSLLEASDVTAGDACGGLGNPCMIEASGATAERLDLTWWGTWATVGLLFIVIAAPRWFAAFRVNHGG